MTDPKGQVKEFYENIVKDGVFPPIMEPGAQQFFDSIDPRDTETDSELWDMALQSRTAGRREHSFDTYEPAANWAAGDTVELARLAIPHGHLGIIRRIDTLVIDDTTGEPISSWANPDSWDNVFQFCLMYNQIYEEQISETRFVDLGVAPSAPFYSACRATPLSMFPTWFDNRYNWGNPSNDIDIPVQDEIFARLFVICRQDTNFKHRVKGRLTLTVQTEASISAAVQARRNARG